MAASVLFLHTASLSFGADAGRTVLSGHVPPVVAQLTPVGSLLSTNRLQLAIGLPLRNQAELDELVRQLYDPASTNFHKFLTPDAFAARFGPTESDYQAVIEFARSNGLAVVGRHPNRVVLDVEGSVSNVEQAFQVTLNVYRHPTEAREFFAPDTEPSVPTNVVVTDIWGLSDYARATPMSHHVALSQITPLNYNGSGPGGSYRGSDFRHAYAPGSNLTGSGQIAAVAEFDGYYANDITTYEANSGYTNVPLQNVLIDGVSGAPGYSGIANAVAEVSLDIELLIAMAPGLSKVVVYEGSNPYDVFNKIATDNTAKQISCSWTWSVGPTHNWGIGNPHTSKTLDSQLQQMAAQGQSFFQAAGDSDAYTGSQAISSSSGPIPVDSIYVTSVGGTSLNMNGTGGSWSSETVWNWGNNTGSGGGVSPNYSIPSWQTNVSMAANNGSTVNHNIPDVALTADAINVIYNNGSSSTFGGTSCAAPLWAGFTALVNQQSAAAGNAPVGFLNPALYAIAGGTNYTACFHDTTTGNNIGSNTPGLYNAVPGYDLATGLGTPNGTNLINALAVPIPLYFIDQPVSQTATNGDNVTFHADAGGQPPFAYQWLFNGTNLPPSANVSGTTSNTLSLASVTLTNAGNYSVIVTNSSGSLTSSVATLTVVSPPSFITQPTNQSVTAGSNVIFSAVVSGTTLLSYQWRTNGINLVDGGNISGSTSNVLNLSAVTITNAGAYTLVVTNAYGSATSSVATLTVMQPPTISVPPAAQTVQCGSNALFTVTAVGTAPLTYLWSLDGALILASANSTLLLTNVHLPNHTVQVIVTNLYGSATNSALLTVQDTLAPVITLNGANPFYVELGGGFVDPGAAATDLCAGSVAVIASGTVNTNSLSTNTLTYSASDGNGNTSTANRTVIVRDTTPPTISWSFTNLFLSLDTNCSANMPDVTGTNFVLATDLSGAVTITQDPTNTSPLALGTNVVVLTVTDSSGNAAYSTNNIVVSDTTPPAITSQPQDLTSTVGGTATFSVAANACTPLTFQWIFNNSVLTNQTADFLTLTNLSFADAGSYFVIATSAGGSSTSAVATLTVNLNPSSLALAASANPSGFKDSVTFTAVVTPTNATGSVQFLTNGTVFDIEPLVAGVASSTNIASLPRGTDQIDAVYSGDATYLSATNTFTEIVTNHPPTVTSVVYTNDSTFTVSIAMADLATNWSDIDGDTVSLTDVSVSTNGITVTNNGTALIYYNSNNVVDQFTCTVTDSFGDSSAQTITIEPAPSPNTTPIISGVAVSPSGAIVLYLSGASGSTYILESATNLEGGTWEPIATNTLDSTGVWQFVDPNSADFPQRFYRLRLAP